MNKFSGRVSASGIAIKRAMGFDKHQKDGLTSSDSDEVDDSYVDLAQKEYSGFVLCALPGNPDTRKCYFSGRPDIMPFDAIPMTPRDNYSVGNHVEKLRVEECLRVYGYKYMVVSINPSMELLPKNVTATAFCGESGNILGDAIVMK